MTNGILLTRHNQEIAQWSPDLFPRERVGSGHKTRECSALWGERKGPYPDDITHYVIASVGHFEWEKED